MKLHTFAEVARTLGCKPRDISDLKYARQLDTDRLVPVGNNHLVPDDYLPTLQALLAVHGKIKPDLATEAK